MALRYCAGGDQLVIAALYGVQTLVVTSSVWDAVDAIHKSQELDIKFPDTHGDQIKVMEGFKAKSSIDINCYVGAIDGILVWTNKSSSRYTKVVKFSPTIFLW